LDKQGNENIRSVCLKILNEVFDGGYLNLVLKKHLRSVSLSSRPFLTALASVAIEKKISIDYYLSPFISGKRVKGNIKNILRMAVAQIMYLNVPEYTVVDEAVKLSRIYGRKQAGFVNAVLRTFLRKERRSLPDENDLSAYLSIKYSFPEWMVKTFINDMGINRATEFLSYEADNKSTYVYDNPLKTSKADLKSYPPYAREVKSITDVENIEEFISGRMSVMGISSMKAVYAVYNAESSALDVCAAPGAKTAYLAALSGGKAFITACDIHLHRIKLIKENLSRLGVDARVLYRDASVTYEDPLKKEHFDLVLVDAPCSALGMVFKKPDIRIHRKEEDIISLAEVSRQILDASALRVKRGGRLAFLTCTVTKAENEDTVNWFLKRNPDFKLVSIDINGETDIMHTMMPSQDGEGFFVCLMEKV